MTDSKLVAAIEALTAEVALLRQALESNRSTEVSVSGAAVEEGAQVVAAAAVAELPVPATNPVTATPPVAAKSLTEIETERVKSEIEAVLVGAFMAGQVEDYDLGFESFLALIHSDRTDAPRSIPSLREFTWKSFHRKREQYLSDLSDATSFTIGRWQPEAPRAKDDNVKLFLECPGRSPVPINFRRDPEHDGAWRITDSSL